MITVMHDCLSVAKQTWIQISHHEFQVLLMSLERFALQLAESLEPGDNSTMCLHSPSYNISKCTT